MALLANQTEAEKVANKRPRLHLRLFPMKNLPSSFIWIFVPFFYPIQGSTDQSQLVSDRTRNKNILKISDQIGLAVRGFLILSLLRLVPQNIPNHSMHGIILCLLFSCRDFYFSKTDF